MGGNGSTRKYRLIVGTDIAEVVKAKKSMEAAWAIMMALSQTEKPYLKQFQLEVLNEIFRDVDAGLAASHKHFLGLIEE